MNKILEFYRNLRRKMAVHGVRPVDAVYLLIQLVTLGAMLAMVTELRTIKQNIGQDLTVITEDSKTSLQNDFVAAESAEQMQKSETLLVNPAENVPKIVMENESSMEIITQTTAVAPDVDGNVEDVLAQMSLEDKIYQLFIVTPEVLVDNYYSDVTMMDSVVSGALAEHPVGGIIFFSQDIQTRSQITSLISDMQGCMGDVGLWIAVDEEGGVVARCAKNLGTTSYNSMQTYGARGDKDEIYQVGVGIAADISQFGFNLDFAPVADVNLNPGNELGDRIFSKDPAVVSEMVGSMVKGLQSGGKVSATLKHFPGLGAEDGNTHQDSAAYIYRTYDELEAAEFVAFRGGIDAGADFVMVGHQIMNCAGDNLPSDLSKTVVTDWLRGNLGFQGVVVTDAHNMNTISNNYGSGVAAKMAIQAGVDIVLMPTDLNAAYNAVYRAVQSGEIPESRIDESVRRILSAKEKHGLLNS